MMIDTNHLDVSLRPYLQLLIATLFELPIKNSEVNFTHEQTVYELNKDLLEFDGSIGINGDVFEPGIFPQYLSIFTKVILLLEIDVIIKIICLIDLRRR